MCDPITATHFSDFVTGNDDLDVLRMHYCYQLGSVVAP
jgi:hypothetical protein